MPDVAPCPWCEDGGKPFLHKEHHPKFAYAVMCHACGARGPLVTFDHGDGRQRYEDIVNPVRAKAIRLWNEWYELHHGDDEESSSEDCEEGASYDLVAVS